MENRKKLEKLLKNKFQKNVYISLYTLLKESKHTSNDNGFFFNLAEVPEENIKKCIEYIEHIEYNIEDHLKNLNIRENLENEFKTNISSNKPPKKQLKNKQNIKESTSKEKPLVAKKVYEGVYKRLDRVVKGLKKEEIKPLKHKKKIVEVEEKEDEFHSEDEDLFGSECSEVIIDDIGELSEDNDSKDLF
jgi:hypothetical protein